MDLEQCCRAMVSSVTGGESHAGCEGRTIRTVDKEDEARTKTDNTRPDQRYLHQTLKGSNKRGGRSAGAGERNGLNQ